MAPQAVSPTRSDPWIPALLLTLTLLTSVASSAFATVTTYRYDALGNLVEVRQEEPGDEVQVRSFEYDGLGRLIREDQPENGTTFYRYDRAGNLVEKRDARLVRTISTYDALDRLLTRSFSPSFAFPEAFEYQYDGAVLQGTGRLFRVRELEGGVLEGESLFLYDPLGRVIREERMSLGITTAVQYTYNDAGARSEIRWPATLNEPDLPDVFRTFEVDDQLRTTRAVFGTGAGPGTVLVDGHTFEHTATGATETTFLRTDNRRYEETVTYNRRLQPVRHRVVDATSGQVHLNLTYDYGDGQNNGSLRSRVDTVRPEFSLDFVYDGGDRLVRTRHPGSPTTQPWDVLYTYDRFGNRTDSRVLLGSPPNNYVTVEGLTFTGNRSDGWLYDPVGNQIGNSPTDTPFVDWDGDNRVREIRNTAAGTARYTYDAQGRRVRKATDTETRTYFRDLGGDVFLEWVGASDASRLSDVARVFVDGKLRYTFHASTSAPGGNQVVFPDTLGSPVLKVDWNTDAVLADTYYPFGQQLNAPQDPHNSHRFTGQERDAETGLTYFGARYYQDAVGRFVSVDPERGSANPAVPQTWNRYAYVRNNPLKFVDPDGRQEEQVTIRRARTNSDGVVLEQVGDPQPTPPRPAIPGDFKLLDAFEIRDPSSIPPSSSIQACRPPACRPIPNTPADQKILGVLQQVNGVGRSRFLTELGFGFISKQVINRIFNEATQELEDTIMDAIPTADDPPPPPEPPSAQQQDDLQQEQQEENRQDPSPNGGG